MSLPIERFKDAYVNHRWNPFTDTDMAVDASEDGLIIPAGSPFIIQLLEQPRKNDPTSISVRCYGVKTDVDEESLSGQKVLKVAATAGFSEDDTIIINRGGDREEERIIDTIQGGISLTVTVNLEYTHTAVQADDVEKFIAFTETAGAPAQSQFRVDYPEGDGGTCSSLVEFNQNDAEKEVRVNYKATGSSALAETLDTKISYPAGSPNDNQIVGFSSGEPYWLQLPHANLAGVSADQHHAQAHTLASHSSKAHSELTGISANQHHAQSHTHGSHSGIGANDHHAQVHTLGSHSDFGSYIDQALKTTSSPTFVETRINICALRDTGADHVLRVYCNENLSTNRDFKILVGNANRTLTLSGNPTLADWFNQAVKQASNVLFNKVTLGGAGVGEINSGTLLNLKAGSSVVLQTTGSGPPTTTLFNNSVTFELDEIGHNLYFKVKYSDGTQKAGSVSLS